MIPFLQKASEDRLTPNVPHALFPDYAAVCRELADTPDDKISKEQQARVLKLADPLKLSPREVDADIQALREAKRLRAMIESIPDLKAAYDSWMAKHKAFYKTNSDRRDKWELDIRRLGDQFGFDPAEAKRLNDEYLGWLRTRQPEDEKLNIERQKAHEPLHAARCAEGQLRWLCEQHPRVLSKATEPLLKPDPIKE